MSENSIYEKIEYLKENIGKIKSLSRNSKEEFFSDSRNIDSAKYRLQTCVESMIDIANILVAKKKLGSPVTSYENFEILYKNGYLSSENIKKYESMIKFINRIVHVYDNISDDVIYDIVTHNIGDFDLFLKEIVIAINK